MTPAKQSRAGAGSRAVARTRPRCPVLALAAVAVFATATGAQAQVTSAAQICAAGVDPCQVTTNVLVADGANLDFGNRALIIGSTGRLTSPGGSIAITARSLTIDSGGQINLRQPNAGGGGLDLTVTGDVNVSGRIDVGGDSAGSITATFANFVLNSNSAAQILLDGTTSSAIGGTLDLCGDQITLNGRVNLNGGSESLGGDALIEGSTTVVIGGLFTSDGGESDAGSIDVASGGDLLVSTTATIRATGSASGGGGAITLTAGAALLGSGTGTLTMRGKLEARGGSSTEGGGDGGPIDLASGGACDLAGSINARNGQPEGTGGDISISCDENPPPAGPAPASGMQMASQIDVQGLGSGGTAGSVELSTLRGDIIIAKGVDAVGSDGGGGEVTVAANGNIRVADRINANALNGGSGGTVDLSARSGTASSILVTSAGSITADGNSGGLGGSIRLDACETLVDLAGGAGAQSCTARGAQGAIELTGVRRIRVGGRLTAGAPGRITLTYRDFEPLFESTASFSPSALTMLDERLTGCGTPAPTRTRTPTRTPTSTPTRTVTRTPTTTASRTVTATASATLTPTAVPTITGTRPPTSTPTWTRRPAPTATPPSNFVRFVAGSARAKPGDRFRIGVAIASAGRQVVATSTDLHLDPDSFVLDPDSCEAAPGEGRELRAIEVAGGVRVFVEPASPTAPAIADGALYSCAATIRPAALPGSYPATIENAAAFGRAGEPLTGVEWRNGAVEVALVPLPGDLDYDGAVTNLDVPLLIETLYSPPPPPPEAYVNEDDRLGVADLLALLRRANR